MHAGHCLVPPGPHGVRVRLTADRVSAHTGKERLAACLGVPVQEAARFLESFLQKYKKIKDFTQATIARCQQTGEPAASKAVGSPHSPPGPPLVGGGGPWSRVSSRPAGEVGPQTPCEEGPEPGSAQGLTPWHAWEMLSGWAHGKSPAPGNGELWFSCRIYPQSGHRFPRISNRTCSVTTVE